MTTKTIRQQTQIIAELLDLVFGDTLPNVVDTYRNGGLLKKAFDLTDLTIGQIINISDRALFLSVQGITIAKLLNGDEEETGISKDSFLCQMLRKTLKQVDEVKMQYLFLYEGDKETIALKIGELAKKGNYGLDFVYKNAHRPTIVRLSDKCKADEFPKVYSTYENVGEYYLALYYVYHRNNLKNLTPSEADRIFNQGDLTLLMNKMNDCEDKSDMKNE